MGNKFRLPKGIEVWGVIGFLILIGLGGIFYLFRTIGLIAPPKNITVQERLTPHNLYGIDFVDLKTGWAVGYNGIILHTKDEGENWEFQPSGTRDAKNRIL